MARLGLNAHLLAPEGSYRSAGVSRYIAKLLTYLPQVGPEHEFVAFVGDPATIESCEGSDRWLIRQTAAPADSPLRRIAWEQVRQPLDARRLGLDLLHAPVNVGPLLTRRPLVVTVHDLSFLRYPELFRPFNRAYLSRWTRWSLRRAARIIAVSSSTRQDLIDLYRVPPERIAVVPNGVDKEIAPVDDPERLRRFCASRGVSRPFILSVGTLEPRKNLPTLLNAFALLRRQEGLAHTLVLVGGRGWYYEEIDATVDALGLTGHVHIAGHVPGDELALWYSAADLFCYPSMYEGFGLPPLEAMACGTPVVTSNTSSLPEVVGDAGLMVDPADVEGLAAHMARVLSDPDLRARLRKAGPERAAQFSWRATAERTLAVYEDALRQGVRAGD